MAERMASPQFQIHSPMSIGDDFYKARGQQYIDVLPLSSETGSSAARNAAWRIHRGPHDMPMPLSYETSGSTRKWKSASNNE